MVTESDRRSERSAYLENILNTPEHPDLRRLTTLVAHLFHVPVAYMALFGATDKVVARIGSGTEYAACLGALHLDHLLSRPQLVRDVASDLPPGTDLGDLQFAASAVLRSSSGLQFGVLMIADREPRPEFSVEDFVALADLAGVLAGRMEFRMIASLALESEISLGQTRDTKRSIADCAPVPLFYQGADGVCRFLNQAWLDFSGRSLEQELSGDWVNLIHPDYYQAMMEEYWISVEGLRPFTAEAPLRRHDGSYRWMLCKAAPRFVANGTFDGYVGVLIDIGDYRRNGGAADSDEVL
jgi:PAS domain S-box-containing protein